MVDYWVRSDIVAVLVKYERTLLVNIANETGDGQVSDGQFVSTYESAVTRMRSAGIRVPLVIDGTSCGQDIGILERNGAALTEADPLHNLLYSVHIYWSSSAQIVRQRLETAVQQGLPFVIG